MAFNPKPHRIVVLTQSFMNETSIWLLRDRYSLHCYWYVQQQKQQRRHWLWSLNGKCTRKVIFNEKWWVQVIQYNEKSFMWISAFASLCLLFPVRSFVVLVYAKHAHSAIFSFIKPKLLNTARRRCRRLLLIISSGWLDNVFLLLCPHHKCLQAIRPGIVNLPEYPSDPTDMAFWSGWHM